MNPELRETDRTKRSVRSDIRRIIEIIEFPGKYEKSARKNRINTNRPIEGVMYFFKYNLKDLKFTNKKIAEIDSSTFTLISDGGTGRSIKGKNKAINFKKLWQRSSNLEVVKRSLSK